MRIRTFGSVPLRKSIALLTCLVLANGALPVALAQDTGAFVSGVILDPAGAPAKGFKVVLRDTASNQTFESTPADAEGNYATKVPLGGQYKIEYVLADDGVTKLPVQDVPPVSVLTAGTTRVNVRFTSTPVTTAAAPAAAAAGTEEATPKAAKPWYKRPGPIVGIVLGAAAVTAILVGGGSGSSSSPASPSTPNP